MPASKMIFAGRKATSPVHKCVSVQVRDNMDVIVRLPGRFRSSAAICLLAVAAVHTTPAVAQQPAAPPLVQQLNNGNWLPQSEAEALRDELYYQRAVFAYMTMLPVLNTIGMRDGSEDAFGKGYNVLPIWKDRMDSRAWVPTPNADVIYSMSYLDLKETGPLVVAAPRDVIGMFTDFVTAQVRRRDQAARS